MGKLDQGLGAIGLLALATVLAILLTAGIPVLLAPEPIKVSDWLGFGGSLAGALVALIAAATAWRAVQRQITAQAELATQQMAIQSFGALVRHIEDLRQEDALQQRLGKLGFDLKRLNAHYLGEAGTTRFSLIEAERRYHEKRLALTEFHDELKRTDSRRWLIPSKDSGRFRIVRATTESMFVIGNFEALLRMRHGGSFDISPLPASILEELREKAPKPVLVSEACQAYSFAIRKAERRVMMQMAKSQKAIGI